MARRIEKQVIREMVCSKMSWHLDRGSPFFKMSGGSGRIRGMCGNGSEGRLVLGLGGRASLMKRGCRAEFSVTCCQSLELQFLNLFSLRANWECDDASVGSHSRTAFLNLELETFGAR